MSRYDLPKKIPDKYYGLLLQILMLENKKERKDLFNAIMKDEIQLSCSTATLDRILSGNAPLEEKVFFNIIEYFKISLPKPIWYYCYMVWEYQNAILKEKQKAPNRKLSNFKKLDILQNIKLDIPDNTEFVDKFEIAEKQHLLEYENRFMDIVSSFSEKEKNILLNCARIVRFTNNYDEFFLIYYLDLNQTGKKILREFLNKFSNSQSLAYTDDICQLCDCAIDIISSDSITAPLPQTILNECSRYYSIASTGYFLSCLPQIDIEGWNLFKLYRQIILTHGDEIVEDYQNGEIKVSSAIDIFVDNIMELECCKSGTQYVDMYFAW